MSKRTKYLATRRANSNRQLALKKKGLKAQASTVLEVAMFALIGMLVMYVIYNIIVVG